MANDDEDFEAGGIMPWDTQPRTLWAHTKIGDVPVAIFNNGSVEFESCEGVTCWFHGKMCIDIAEDVFKDDANLRRLLMHEFTHVCEYTNDIRLLSPKLIDSCTLLAQTMEFCMTELWENLTLVKSSKRTASKVGGIFRKVAKQPARKSKKSKQG